MNNDTTTRGRGKPTAFRCVQCGGKVYASNPLAERLMLAGRPAMCADCVRGGTIESGITYREYLESDEWKRRAERAKEKAGRRCQVCNGAENLQAHHRTYENLGHEADSDLTVLCDDCHRLFSKGGKLKA